MSYIGINPNQDLAQRFTEVFTGNGVQTQFTLPIAPGSTNAVDVSVGGVDQIGGVNFSVSGNTLTFLTGAPESGQLIKVLFTAEINTGDYSRTRNTRKSFNVVATAGQTVFAIPGGYDPGHVDVFLNGVKLILGTDFDGTSGTVITLTDPATAGDEIDVIAYGIFFVSGSVNKAGDTMTGPLVVPAGATGAQVPRASEVVRKAGDTMTGPLGVNSITNATGTGAPNFPNGLTAPSITVGALPTFQCRAWVNFNGTGTAAIRASGNVSSITKNGTGDYTVNFTTAMPDANYCVTGACSIGNSISNSAGILAEATSSANTFASKTVSGVRVVSSDNNTDNIFDAFTVNVAIFR